jgi:hypothetical protein
VGTIGQEIQEHEEMPEMRHHVPAQRRMAAMPKVQIKKKKRGISYKSSSHKEQKQMNDYAEKK